MARDYKWAWGPYINPRGLPELYESDKKLKERTVPKPGIDNLGLKSLDFISIPGVGHFAVDFEGYFQVVRGEPTSYDWNDSAMVVNYTDLKLFGKHSKLGGITVSLNRDVLSAGETFPSVLVRNAQSCRIAVSAQFEMEDMGMTLFNKEPILLKNDSLDSIPPVNEPSIASVYHLPLFDMKDPDGKARAHLTELRYTVLDYVDKKTATAYSESGSLKEFNKIMKR